MGQVKVELSMSLDGFVAGRNPSLEEPLGAGGERLHEWVVRLASWRAPHGLEGGETGPDDDIFAESLASTRAVVMGRKMFSGGSGPWADDPNADGWWGDDPPFHAPVFVVTHHPRDKVEKSGGTSFAFVTDGVEAALDRARDAAGGGDVLIAGGADVAQQALAAGRVDRLQLHVVPLLLGGGTRMFADGEPQALEQTQVVPSTQVTHLTYLPR
jgi:dihydrofolate reductase